MLVGILLIINSLSHFQKVLLLKDNGFEQWKVNLAGAIFILVVGIVLLMKPIQSLDFIFSLTGFFLVLNGILIFLDQYFIQKRIYKSKHTLLIICIVANIFSGFFACALPFLIATPYPQEASKFTSFPLSPKAITQSIEVFFFLQMN